MNSSKTSRTGHPLDAEETDSAALTRYLETIGKIALLDHDEEISLATAAQAGDSGAMKALVEANLRLVVHFAAKYSRYGVPVRELISEGNFGLMRAVRTYEPRTESRFSNYAVWWIRRHILRHLNQRNRNIYLPANKLAVMAKVNAFTEAYRENHGHDASVDEIAKATGIAKSTLSSLVDSGRTTLSFESPLAGGDNPASLGDFIADSTSPSPATLCDQSSDKAVLTGLLDCLGEREAEIIRLRFGLDDGDESTCETIGNRYGLTRERVRQIQEVALKKLRTAYLERSRCRTADEREEERKTSARQEVMAEFFQDMQRRRESRPGPGSPCAA